MGFYFSMRHLFGLHVDGRLFRDVGELSEGDNCCLVHSKHVGCLSLLPAVMPARHKSDG